jgi:hypothetical protein
MDHRIEAVSQRNLHRLWSHGEHRPGIEHLRQAHEPQHDNKGQRVSRINVLVAATSPDMKAEGIAAAVAQRTDMTLVENRVLPAEEVGTLLDAMPHSAHCALVLVGPHAGTEETTARWLEDRTDLVVLRVDINEDLVRIAVRDVGLDSLLTALRELVDRAGSSPRERVSQFQVRPLPAGADRAPEATTSNASKDRRTVFK